MSRRRKVAATETDGSHRVLAVRLDPSSDELLDEEAKRLGTTPGKYAKAFFTAHLQGLKAAPAAASPAHGLDELGEFLHQVRDELVQEAERRGKQLDTVTVRVNAVGSHLKALIEQVKAVDQRLA